MRGVHDNRLTSVSTPRLRIEFRRTGGLLTQVQYLDACSRACQKMLRRLVPSLPTASVVYPPFRYSRNSNVHLNRRMFIGTGYAFLSKTFVAVKDRALVNPYIRVCAPRRPVSCLRHHGPGRCTCPMAVNRSY